MKKKIEYLNNIVKECEQVMGDLGFELPRQIEYKLNNRLKRTLGRCRKIIEGEEYIIEIATFMVDVAIEINDDVELMNTILHEMCHALPNCYNHGDVWKSKANIINDKYGFTISRTTSLPPIYNKVRYAGKTMVTIGCVNGCWSCSKANTSVHVRKINDYRCSKCSGKLEILK